MKLLFLALLSLFSHSAIAAPKYCVAGKIFQTITGSHAGWIYSCDDGSYYPTSGWKQSIISKKNLPQVMSKFGLKYAGNLGSNLALYTSDEPKKNPKTTYFSVTKYNHDYKVESTKHFYGPYETSAEYPLKSYIDYFGLTFVHKFDHLKPQYSDFDLYVGTTN